LKIYLLQILVEKQHEALLYPRWSNASDLREMPYSFDTLVLHSEELHEAVLNKKVYSDLIHITWSMGVTIPFLPAHGIDETTLFSTIVLEMPVFDESEMAIEWCSHVHGTTIFPKFPVYLRLRFTKWEHTQRV
jgi:hypothetical protein